MMKARVGRSMAWALLMTACLVPPPAAASSVVSITPDNATLSFDDGVDPVGTDEEIEFTAVFEPTERRISPR